MVQNIAKVRDKLIGLVNRAIDRAIYGKQFSCEFMHLKILSGAQINLHSIKNSQKSFYLLVET